IDDYLISYRAEHCSSVLIPEFGGGSVACLASRFLPRPLELPPFPPGPDVPDVPPPPDGPFLLTSVGFACEPADELCVVATTSEPGTLTLLLAGVAGLGAALCGQRRKRRI